MSIEVTTYEQYQAYKGTTYEVLPHFSFGADEPTGRKVKVRRISGDGKDVETWCDWHIPVSRLKLVSS